MELIAKTLAGLEPALVKELESLGAEKIVPLHRAVKYHGDKKILYRSNLELRTALRILVPVTRFKCKNEKSFYQGIQRLYWDKFLTPEMTIAVDSVVSSPYFKHSKYMALLTKDAIVDQIRNRTGKRPSVDIDFPDLRINTHIMENKCTISLDSSAWSLHKRAYRIASVTAPIIETLAAGLILLSEWNKTDSFIDPMCGSGTFLIEAAKIASNRTPHFHSAKFGFMKWRDYDIELWNTVVNEAKEREIPLNTEIIGFDKNGNALNAARYNIAEAGFAGKINLEKKDLFENKKFRPGSWVIFNPPYDIRLKVEDVIDFFQKIGDHMKNEMAGCVVWIISSNIEALKKIGLRAGKKYSVYNGPNPAKFHKFEIYEGSKKSKK